MSTGRTQEKDSDVLKPYSGMTRATENVSFAKWFCGTRKTSQGTISRSTTSWTTRNTFSLGARADTLPIWRSPSESLPDVPPNCDPITFPPRQSKATLQGQSSFRCSLWLTLEQHKSSKKCCPPSSCFFCPTRTARRFRTLLRVGMWQVGQALVHLHPSHMTSSHPFK